MKKYFKKILISIFFLCNLITSAWSYEIEFITREIDIIGAASPTVLNNESQVFGFNFRKGWADAEYFIWSRDKGIAYYPVPIELNNESLFKSFYQRIVCDTSKINSKGEFPFIVISKGLLKNSWQLYLWNPETGTQKLGEPVRYNGSEILAIHSINDKGNIVVSSTVTDNYCDKTSFHFWDDGTFALPKEVYVGKDAINHLGECTYYTYFRPNLEFKPSYRIWIKNIQTHKAEILLETEIFLKPLFLNDRHQIAGDVNDKDSFVWSKEKGVQYISNFKIISCNNQGQLLGKTSVGHFGIWKDGKLNLMHDFPYEIKKVYQINDKGEILAEIKYGQEETVLIRF